MIQTITIDEKQADFLEKFSQYGFQTQKELVDEALMHLRKDLEQSSLIESADLYAEVYAEDEELQQLTELALLERVND